MNGGSFERPPEVLRGSLTEKGCPRETSICASWRPKEATRRCCYAHRTVSVDEETGTTPTPAATHLIEVGAWSWRSYLRFWLGLKRLRIS